MIIIKKNIEKVKLKNINKSLLLLLPNLKFHLF